MELLSTFDIVVLICIGCILLFVAVIEIKQALYPENNTWILAQCQAIQNVIDHDQEIKKLRQKVAEQEEELKQLRQQLKIKSEEHDE